MGKEYTEEIDVAGRIFSKNELFEFYNEVTKHFHSLVQNNVLKKSLSLSLLIEGRNQGCELLSIEEFLEEIHSKDVIQNFQLIYILFDENMQKVVGITFGAVNKRLSYLYIAGKGREITDNVSRATEDIIYKLFKKIGLSKFEEQVMLDESISKVTVALNETRKKLNIEKEYVLEEKNLEYNKENVREIEKAFFHKFGYKHRYVFPIVTIFLTVIGIIVTLILNLCL